jgi:urease accessory protein
MKRIPSQFAKYEYFEGESGSASLGLSRSGSRTVLGRLRTKAPLLVQRAMYPEQKAPGMAHIYLMSSAGGILQGDRMEITVDAGKNTASRITTQAATKIYRMEHGFASQTISLCAHSGSYVEFLPHQLIPFKSSRFYQDVSLAVSHDSTAVYSETLSAGRTASGENFEFDVCFLRMTARDMNGRMLFSDVCCMEPEKMRYELLFGGKTIWSTVYVITPNGHESIDRGIMEMINERTILAGCSKLPHDCGLFVRILDDSIDRIRDLTIAIARIARKHAMASG